MDDPTFEQKMQAVERLTATFKMERIVYLVLTALSAITIIGIGLYLAIQKSDYKSFITLSIPTGTLTLCIGRIYKMWDDIMTLIKN